MTDPLLTFDSTAALATAALLVTAAGLLAAVRKITLPPVSQLLGMAGLAVLAVAAGSPVWRAPAASEVAVLVDLSPSTRGAACRDRAFVDRRARELLGATPFRVYTFADGPATAAAAGGGWAEVPARQTTFAPPAAPAVLLFSDGRFKLPAAAPPTYAVVDPNLATAADGRVAALTIDGGDAVATVHADRPRSLAWAGVDGPAGEPVPPGTAVIRRPITAGPGAGAGTAVSARLSTGDQWPENDGLQLVPPPPAEAQRWFVTAGPFAPPGYRRLAAADLPTAAADYLAAAVVVLDNVPAAAIPAAARDRLGQYVRDLGGGLVIVGGDRAFAAGGYVGTTLDALSPLAAAPPRPAARWILLTDGSGSMSADAGGGGGGAGRTAGRSRFQAATDALVRLLPSVPPDDPVDLGSFAADVRWWTAGAPAGEARKRPLPPAGVAPGGPTNLRPAVEAAVARHDLSLPANLLLLTDADAEVGDEVSLVGLLRSRNVKLHLLAVGGGRGLDPLRRVVEQAGGSVVRQDDAGRWGEAAAELLQSAADARLVTDPTTVTFAGGLTGLGPRSVSPWNRTWLKPRATALATGGDVDRGDGGSDPIALAAAWQAGEGRVAAAAFAATPAELAALSAAVARPPRDPRVAVTYVSAGTLRVRVDTAGTAADAAAGVGEPYLNGRAVTLELSAVTAAAAAPPRMVPVVQTAPGRYEVELPAPDRPSLATVRVDGRAVDRFAVAGRYAPEFDAVGTDRDNLRRLAERTGGAVIEPADSRPIDFRWPRRDVPLAPWLAATGAALLVAGLLWWRWA